MSDDKYQQELFERYSEQLGYRDFEEGEPDYDGRACYRNPNTQGRWNFWVASRDALSTPPAVMPAAPSDAGPNGDMDFRKRIARLLAEMHGDEILSEQQCAKLFGVDLVSWRNIEHSFAAGASMIEPDADGLLSFPATSPVEDAIKAAFRCADCKAPLREGWTCDACGSDSAEDTPAAGEQAGAVDEIEQLREQRDALRRALEVIAVGDSPDPVRDAGDELVGLGYWRKEGLAGHRALAAPGSAIAAREQESLLSDEELSLLQRVEQDMQMFSEGRYPYDSNRMPNQKWRRATIADVERRFKGLMPRFAALTTKLMNTSREEASATPQAGLSEQQLYDIIRGTGYVTRGQAWDIVELILTQPTTVQQAEWYGDKSPLHQSLCMHPDPCGECDRIAALKGMQSGERKEGA